MVKNPLVSGGDTVLISGTVDPLKKEKATNSSILAWEIPWTEEPDGLRLQRVRHVLANNNENNRIFCV